MDEMLEGLDDGTGAVNTAALRKLLGNKAGASAMLGSLIKDKGKAAALIKKLRGSKSKAAQHQAAILSALMQHEAIHQSEAMRAPTVMVNLYFPAVAAGASSATASLRTPYANQRWALTAVESFCTVSPDPGLLIQFNPGGVDLAVSPTTQSVTWSAGAPQPGIPSATFGTLNTRRTDAEIAFRPWTRRSRIFTATDFFNVQIMNAGAAAASWFILLKLISSPCAGGGFKMKPVHPSWFSQVQARLHMGG